MSFFEKELNGFDVIYKYVDRNEDGIYELSFNNKIIRCNFETCYESDNGLDENDENYDEYEVIVFSNIDNNYNFEINYKNIPDEVYHNGKLVYKNNINGVDKK